MINDCTAIILAGGDSRRMGRDKAMLPFANQTLIQSVIETIQPLFSTTILSVRETRPEIKLPQVCDAQANGGPLVGMVTALEKITTSWAFVVACDMPFVSPALIKQLAKLRVQQHAIVPVVYGQLQPLAAFYSTSGIPFMRASLALKNKSFLGVIKNMQVSYVDEAKMLQSDPQLNSFFDLDTPQDLLAAQGMR